MAWPVTSFSPTVQGLKVVPAGWLDTGQVRANVFYPDPARFGRGPFDTGILHVDLGAFIASTEITVIDDSGDTPGLLIGALNSGVPVVTLTPNEAGAPYLDAYGKGLLFGADHARFLDPLNPLAPKDCWGAFTFLKKYGRALCGVDFSRGACLSGSSSAAISLSWMAWGDNRAGRYAALETDACLAEMDSRPTVFVNRVGTARFRSLETTTVVTAFPNLVADPTGQTACTTLASADSDAMDAWSALLTTTTFEARDRNAAARMWSYLTTFTDPGSASYFKTVSSNWQNGGAILHDAWSPRVWKLHTGYPRTRSVVGNAVTFDAALDSAQLSSGEPSSGSVTDMLDFVLAHLEAA